MLAAIGDDDRRPLVSSDLLCLHAEVRVHVIACGTGTGTGGAAAAASEVLLVIEVFQGVAAKREGCMFVVGVGVAERRGRRG